MNPNSNLQIANDFTHYLKCKFFHIITIVKCGKQEKHSTYATPLKKLGLPDFFRVLELQISLKGIQLHVESINDLLCANIESLFKVICSSLGMVCAIQICDLQSHTVLGQAQLSFQRQCDVRHLNIHMLC